MKCTILSTGRFDFCADPYSTVDSWMTETRFDSRPHLWQLICPKCQSVWYTYKTHTYWLQSQHNVQQCLYLYTQSTCNATPNNSSMIRQVRSPSDRARHWLIYARRRRRRHQKWQMWASVRVRKVNGVLSFVLGERWALQRRWQWRELRKFIRVPRELARVRFVIVFF